MKMGVNDFLNLMEESQEVNKIVRFGSIAANYTTGNPAILFDGMDNASIKTYPYLSSYTPVANDRVMLIKNVIVGNIVQNI